MNRITCIETSDLQRKRIHERVLVRKASNRFFAVCYPFKIDEMPFEQLGLFVRKKYSAVRVAAPIRSHSSEAIPVQFQNTRPLINISLNAYRTKFIEMQMSDWVLHHQP